MKTLMVKSTAERQADYRSKIAGTHKRVEIILDQTAYTKLKTLVKKSDYPTRIEYITALIEKEHNALSGHISLPDNQQSAEGDDEKKTLPSNIKKKVVARKRPTKKSGNVIEIWWGESHCQGQTAHGTRCRIKHHLSVIKYKSGKITYEVVSCKQHFNRFTLHESLVQ